MSEIVTTYSLKDLNTAIPMDRAEFYKEQIELFEKGKKPSKAIAIMDILIFDDSGELFIQKRSDNKAHNAGMLDKSIGGHIAFGDPTDYTVMVESVQELQVPSITLRTEIDFQKTYHLLRDYLNTIAIAKHVDTRVYELKNKIKGQHIPVMKKIFLYFAIYNGAVKSVDREAKGVLLYTLKDLEREMNEFPNLFTDDLNFLVKQYRSQILQFIKTIKRK